MAKRAFDFLFSVIGLVAITPVMLLLALIITIDSKAAKNESDSVSGDLEEKELDWAKNRRVEFFIEK